MGSKGTCAGTGIEACALVITTLESEKHGVDLQKVTLALTKAS